MYQESRDEPWPRQSRMLTYFLLWFKCSISWQEVQKQEINLTSELVPASMLDDNVCAASSYFTYNAMLGLSFNKLQRAYRYILCGTVEGVNHS